MWHMKGNPMKTALCGAVVCAISGTAWGAPFAALSLGSVSPASASNVIASGEGTQSVGLAGDLGPFFPGAFTVTVGLTFTSFSVPGDGVAAFLTLIPDYDAGNLSVTGFTLGANLFDGAQHVSALSAQGDISTSFANQGAFDLTGIAHSFDKSGAAPFQFIGDHGSIQVTIDFLWTGASEFDTLRLNIGEGSAVEYLSFVPAPGVASALAIGGLALGARRRR